jgi:hypothetical protein
MTLTDPGGPHFAMPYQSALYSAPNGCSSVYRLLLSGPGLSHPE